MLPQALENAFEFFLSGCTFKREVTTLLINELEKLKKAILTQQKFSFLGSSVLLIYEGDINAGVMVDVRLIDFDHATVDQEKQLNFAKREALAKIQNVIQLLDKIKSHQQT